MTNNDVLVPWIEKYRPLNLNEMCSHSNILFTIKNLIENNKLPHLLFYGPPGTGKTSLILCCAYLLYKKNIQVYTIHLNASDERGIDVVRERIKDFCNGSILFYEPKIKLVILDEADSMTEDAQLALRELIFKNTNKVRFCLICNYISKIIPQLKSRFSSFKFTPISNKDILERVQEIVKKENIICDTYSLKVINKISKGDFRKYINILQILSSQEIEIEEKNIHQLLSYPTKKEIEDIFEIIISNDTILNKLHFIKTIIIQENYEFEIIINLILENIFNYSIDNEKLIFIIQNISEIQIYKNIHIDLKICKLIVSFKDVNNNNLLLLPKI
jgi:replication factor C subunit 3/5